METFSSTLNSYEGILTQNQELILNWENTENYTTIQIDIYNNNLLDSNEFIIEFSNDEIDIISTISSIKPGGRFITDYNVYAKYFRIVYKNTNECEIKIKTILYRQQRDKFQVVPTDTLTSTQNALVTRDISNYKKDVALNLITNVKNYVVNGVNTVSSENYINNLSSFSWITSATRIKVVKTSVNDDILGIGARAVYVSGLNSDYEEISETIFTDGSFTTLSFFRINSASVVSSGSLRKNDGDLFVTSELDENLTTIKAGESRALSCIYTVPKDYCAVIPRVLFMCDSEHSASFRGYFREYSTNTDYLINVMQGLSGSFESKPEELVKFNEKTDFWITAKKETGTGDANVSVCYEVNLNRIV